MLLEAIGIEKRYGGVRALKHVSFDLPAVDQTQSETDLRRRAGEPMQGRYETSDAASYEDLMEFALEVENNR